MVTDNTPTASRRDPDGSRDTVVGTSVGTRVGIEPVGTCSRRRISSVNRSIVFIMFDVRRRRRYFGGSSGGSASPAVAAPHLPTNTASAASARPPSVVSTRSRAPSPEKRLRECCRGPPYFAFELGGGLVQYVAPEVRLYSKAFGTITPGRCSSTAWRSPECASLVATSTPSRPRVLSSPVSREDRLGIHVLVVAKSVRGLCRCPVLTSVTWGIGNHRGSGAAQQQPGNIKMWISSVSSSKKRSSSSPWLVLACEFCPDGYLSCPIGYDLGSRSHG